MEGKAFIQPAYIDPTWEPCVSAHWTFSRLTFLLVLYSSYSQSLTHLPSRHAALQQPGSLPLSLLQPARHFQPEDAHGQGGPRQGCPAFSELPRDSARPNHPGACSAIRTSPPSYSVRSRACLDRFPQDSAQNSSSSPSSSRDNSLSPEPSLPDSDPKRKADDYKRIFEELIDAE